MITATIYWALTLFQTMIGTFQKVAHLMLTVTRVRNSVIFTEHVSKLNPRAFTLPRISNRART